MPAPQRLGDYLVFPAFAQGGTASVHLGRLVRAGGFRRLVVVKRLKPQFAEDPAAPDRVLREAHLSSRVRSPYVVSTLDVVHRGSDLALIMDLVQGVTLGRLLELASERKTFLAPAVVVAIVCNVLRGLQAAHDATTEDGAPLELTHRDVAPHNVMVGRDGLARVVDFEIAKALGHHGVTASGEVRGTLGYMAPEQLRGGRLVTRQADLYATGVLLWEALTGKRYRDADIVQVLADLDKAATPPSKVRPEVPPALDAVALRALRSEASQRFPSAEAMAAELERALTPAPPQDVARCVEKLALDDLELLRERVAECERYELSTSDGAETTRNQQEELIGSLIAAKYRVESVLGRGGMGIVLEARHVTLGELVAVKLLRADVGGGTDGNERIVREARASLKIKSEHVVRIFDVGIDDGTPYLVMEKLDGTDLRSLLINEGKQAVQDAVLYVLQACEVLAEAHTLGIVHRDIKPANLFRTIRPDGTPCLKVLDFGIAKGGSDAASLPSITDTRSMLGSPAYMSPEQLRSAKHVDERTDLWALGLVLYELLTGAHPFADEDRKVALARIIADEPTPLRERRPELPEGLERIITHCLAKNPDDRMASIGELAVALEPFAPSGQVSTGRIRRITGHAPRAPAVVQAPRPKSGRAVWIALGIAGIGATAFFATRSAGVRPIETPTLITATSADLASPAPPAASESAPPAAPAAPSATTAAISKVDPEPANGRQGKADRTPPSVKPPTKSAAHPPIAKGAPEPAAPPIPAVETPPPVATPPPPASVTPPVTKKRDPTADFE